MTTRPAPPCPRTCLVRAVALGYPGMIDAADAVPGLLAAGPLFACEGLDARIVDVVRAAGAAVPDLPRGAGWLFVEVGATAVPEATSMAIRVAAAAGALESRIVTDRAEQADRKSTRLNSSH